MALEPIESMKRDAYLQNVEKFAKWMLDFVENEELNGLRGWLAHLQAYKWRDSDWRKGIDCRICMAKLLETAWKKCADSKSFEVVVEKILKWGKMNKKFNKDQIKEFQSSCALLEEFSRKGDASRWKNLYAKRIASVSKIYEMHDLDSWIIYDSRSAQGLATLVEEWWKEEKGEACAKWLRFPQPPSRNGGKLNGFPSLSSPAQARLGFIYASWIAQDLAGQLNERKINPPDTDKEWRAFHIEMVLFTIGKSGSEKGHCSA